jgi:hypothetical protein
MAKRRGVKRRSHVPKPARHSKTTRSSNKLLMEPVDYNRTLFTASIITFLAIVFLLVAFSNVQTGVTGSVITGYDVSPGTSYITVQAGDWYSLLGSSPFANVLQYVFGTPIQLTGIVSSIIVTIAVWLLLFFTFGDIIASFSSFHKWVSWTIGGLLTLIMANLGFVVGLVIAFTKLLAVVGIASVYAGLGAAFIAFMLANIGIISAGRWIMNRRILMHGATAKIESEAGGKSIAGVIGGLRAVGTELRNEGKKVNG